MTDYVTAKQVRDWAAAGISAQTVGLSVEARIAAAVNAKLDEVKALADQAMDMAREANRVAIEHWNRADDAEARIDAALAVCSEADRQGTLARTIDGQQWPASVRVDNIRRALTGE